MDEEKRRAVGGLDGELGLVPDGVARVEPSEEPAETIAGESAEELDSDAVTGASPGTAQACSDLGLNSLEENLSKFGIRPPGVA